MTFPFAAVGGALAGLGQLGRFGLGLKQNKLANKINPQYNPYKANPLAAQNLAQTQLMFGGRMAGAANAERNIAASGASQIGNINRNATDSAQALALASGVQGATNQAFTDLQAREQQQKVGMLDNLNRAYAMSIQEGDKEYQDMMRKYQLELEAKTALRNAGLGNMYGAINDTSSLLTLAGMGGFNTKGNNMKNILNLPSGYLNTGG